MAATIYGPTPFIWATNDRFLSESDSIGALDGDAQEFAPMKRALFALADKTPNGPRPMYWNTGISGTPMSTQLARFQVALTKYAPITKVVWTPGIFDIIGSGQAIGTVNDLVNTTWLGSFNLICLLVAGQFQIPMYICGPHFIGEKWPSGQNAADANLDALDAGMRTIVARFPALITYRSNRHDLYDVQEPLLNLPAPGLTNGPLIGSDSQSTHWYPGGRNKAYQLHQQDIKLVAASGPTPVPTVYSGTTPCNPQSLGNWWRPSSLGLANGANAPTWANSGVFGTAFDYTISAATKPTYATPGDGAKINGGPAVNFGGAAWLKTAAATAKGQPFMTAMLFKPATIASSMIWLDGLVDGGLGVQEPYIATLLTSGNVEIHAGVVFDSGPVTAGQWHLLIVYWSGIGTPGASSYVVIDGRWNPLGNCSTDGITGRTVGASAAAGLIANGLIGEPGICEWFSSLGPLPRWQDVQGFYQAVAGPTPQ